MITCSVPAVNFLTFDHMQARKLLLPAGSDVIYKLVLVGCGGTGSWLAPHLARLAKLLDDSGREVDVRFVDPDVVEEVNCYRQNFCPAEIGQFKAQALAERYGMAWGVEIQPICAPFSIAAARNNYMASDVVTVLIGCVDNAAARRDILDAAQQLRCWWLDCGNHHSAGQVLLGKASFDSDPWRLPGFCSWLPLPSKQHPELLDDIPDAPALPAMSCAQAALAGAQGLTINAIMATLAADMLYRMLVTRDLDRYAVYVDLGAGSARSKYILRDEVTDER
jgi:PRTRC genetic system ThiF family protein